MCLFPKVIKATTFYKANKIKSKKYNQYQDKLEEKIPP